MLLRSRPSATTPSTSSRAPPKAAAPCRWRRWTARRAIGLLSVFDDWSCPKQTCNAGLRRSTRTRR
eukprot:8888329-Lingulodinium_polyedra.AAC.1